MLEEGNGVAKILVLVVRGVAEENDKLSALSLEEPGLLEVLDSLNSLDEVELSRGDSLEVRFSFKDSLGGGNDTFNRLA